MKEHIVKSFQREIEALNKALARMGTLAEQQLARSTRAAVEGDEDRAVEVIEGDAEIDRLELEVSEGAVRMMALRQPMAVDLREALAATRIASDLERIGDLAKSNAKRARTLAGLPRRGEPVHRLERLADSVRRMLEEVVQAYVSRDAARALHTWGADPDVDDLHTSLFRELLTYMMEDVRSITVCTHMLFMAKNLERAGDHCVNIASTVHYLVTGAAPAVERPKGEDARLAVVEPVDPSSRPSGGDV